jgi:hypothetical protein
VELSEICRVSFQKNKLEKLVHLVGFIVRNLFDILGSRSGEYKKGGEM